MLQDIFNLRGSIFLFFESKFIALLRFFITCFQRDQIRLRACLNYVLSLNSFLREYFNLVNDMLSCEVVSYREPLLRWTSRKRRSMRFALIILVYLALIFSVQWVGNTRVESITLLETLLDRSNDILEGASGIRFFTNVFWICWSNQVKALSVKVSCS